MQDARLLTVFSGVVLQGAKSDGEVADAMANASLDPKYPVQVIFYPCPPCIAGGPDRTVHCRHQAVLARDDERCLPKDVIFTLYMWM